MKAQDIVDEVRTWIGTPVALSGSVKGKGCNCLGMMAGAANNLGRGDLWQIFEPYRGLAHPPDRLFMIRKLKQSLIATNEVEPGCLLFLREGESSHVAVVTRAGDSTDIVEALPPEVRETILDRRPTHIFRIPGVDYG